MNIYDIYNATLTTDKPFVDAILEQLNADLATNVGNNVFYFVFDLAPYFTEVDTVVQRNRIVDRVLLEMRTAGISCKPVGIHMVEGDQGPLMGNPDSLPMLYTPGFNSTMFDVKSLEINIRVRRDQEFMKTYC